MLKLAEFGTKKSTHWPSNFPTALVSMGGSNYAERQQQGKAGAAEF